MASVSLMFAATAVTVQVVPSGRSEVGSSVIEDPGEPLTEKLFIGPASRAALRRPTAAPFV